MIGKTISELRKRRGLSISELADRAGVSKSYISNIERNINKNPSIQIITKISAVLDTDIKTLLIKESPEKCRELDQEWIEFVHDLQDCGAEKENIHQYKTLIEFIKWQAKTKVKK
ncbi:helix-turn-helix domain-containing protein [Peribacillus sp. SCS-37]|uniref:helix-turn-helix domain-containing protein n=1 Tax=Paraperibacillus esterisolvens TaxID=3115296 RepID=UPI003905F508